MMRGLIILSWLVGAVYSIFAFHQTIGEKPHIVFLITEDPNNYEAHKTIPVFAQRIKKELGYRVTVLLGKGRHGAYSYPGLDIISKADLLVVFTRRIALPHTQLNTLKTYLQSGKPLIGIRTANHAFTVQEKIEEGYAEWPEFVAEVLGCENRGYGPTEVGTDVTIIPTNSDHPIVQKISPQQWHSKGNVYLVTPLLDKEATIVLTGKVNDKIEPVAWTRMAGRSRVFYTSLGYQTDFQTPQFHTLLVNSIQWCLLCVK